jgi:hypothetical protein
MPRTANDTSSPQLPVATAVSFAAGADSDSNTDYCFTPVKGDATDDETQSLFEQLEEGVKWDTDIFQTIKLGANLYAQNTQDDSGCYPIHVAAHSVDGNPYAVKTILETFEDPERRKDYILLKNDDGKNVLEILLERISREADDGLSAPAVVAVLSYLTPDEQRQVVADLPEETRAALEPDEYDSPVRRLDDVLMVSQISRFVPIPMSPQRGREEAVRESAYDSGDEGLGSLGEVGNSKFTARVSYQDVPQADGTVKSVPELRLIPSDWRLPTAVAGDNQGDHVTAYVLLLSSLSHCKGEHIKRLPAIIHEMVVRVLPEQRAQYDDSLRAVNASLEKQGETRRQALSSLKHECDKPEEFLSAVDNSLKRAETDTVAHYIEDTADHFVTTLNGMAGESFSQSRKTGVKINFLLEKLGGAVGASPKLQSPDAEAFKEALVTAISEVAEDPAYDKSGSVTDAHLQKISTKMDVASRDCAVPVFLQRSQSVRLMKQTLLDFLKEHTPLKKHHEGHEIRNLQSLVARLASVEDVSQRSTLLEAIGDAGAKLFDYPRVGDPAQDDVSVLCAAIPRHLIIITYAFKALGRLRGDEKQQMYDAFINHLLVRQLWGDHDVVDAGAQTRPLTADLLKEKIRAFANMDGDGNYSMKPLERAKHHLDQVPRVSLFGHTAAASAADGAIPPPILDVKDPPVP